MSNTNDFATGGGIAGLIAALSYAAKLFYDWKHTPPPSRTHNSAAVADAQTANAILMQTLAGVQSENARLNTRVANLENERDEQDAKIEELEAKLNDIAEELSALKHRA